MKTMNDEKDKKRNIRRITGDTKFCGIPLKDWPDPKPEENLNPNPNQSNKQSIIAKNMLINLKHTELWDPVKFQWNRKMDEKGKLGNSDRHAHVQLVGVLTEYFVGDKDLAKNMHDALKQTVLYDPAKSQWNWYMNKNGKLISSNRPAHAQLLGVLVEFFVGDKDLAKNMHDALKQTKLWDQTKSQWNRWMDEKGKLKDSNRPAHAQLLGVLTEYFVGDKDLAKNMHDALKHTELYDPVKSQWNWYMDENGNLRNSSRYADAQLVGVLTEYFVGDKDLAKNMLINLKQTVLWDSVKFQWNEWMDENGKLENSNRFARDQLLGVLAEYFVGDRNLAKNMLINLKHTILWDKIKSQWNMWMDENGNLMSSARDAPAQLLGVLAEFFVGDKGLAKNMLINLKQTVLWDKVKSQWNWCMDENGNLKDSDRFAYAQLLGILAEYFVGDKDLAKNMLINLKQTVLWDSVKFQWNWRMYKDGNLRNSSRYADAQLLGVLVEAVVGEGIEMR